MIRETELISLKDGKTKSLTEFVQDLAPTPEPMELTPTTPVDTGGADPVALSSYIDGIADTSASDAITAGLASGGNIKSTIDTAVSNVPVQSYTDLDWTVENYFYSAPGHTNPGTISIPKTKNVLIALANSWTGSDGDITNVKLYVDKDKISFIPKDFSASNVEWGGVSNVVGFGNNTSSIVNIDATGSNIVISLSPSFTYSHAIFVFSAD